jgi:hypothetical protein
MATRFALAWLMDFRCTLIVAVYDFNAGAVHVSEILLDPSAVTKVPEGQIESTVSPSGGILRRGLDGSRVIHNDECR